MTNPASAARLARESRSVAVCLTVVTTVLVAGLALTVFSDQSMPSGFLGIFAGLCLVVWLVAIAAIWAIALLMRQPPSPCGARGEGEG